MGTVSSVILYLLYSEKIIDATGIVLLSLFLHIYTHTTREAKSRHLTTKVSTAAVRQQGN